MEQKQSGGPAVAAGAAEPTDRRLTTRAVGRSIAEIIAPAAAPAEYTEAVVLPAELPMYIQSNQDEHSPIHQINPSAIQFSVVLKTMIDVTADKNSLLPFDFSDNQIKFVAELLNFLPETLETGQQLAHSIINIGNRSNLSFADILHLINFFDISIAFTALTAMQQPLPLPTTPVREIEYNKQLAFVFDMAKRSTEAAVEGERKREGAERWWQLFGRMLYPGCERYKEVQAMIDFITAQRGGILTRTVRTVGKKVSAWFRGSQAPLIQRKIEQIVLGVYIQTHPELYSHVLSTMTNHTSAYSVAFSPDGQTIASGLLDNTIKLWNTANGSLIRTLAGHIGPVVSVAFSPDGQTIASGSWDGTILLWNVANGSLIRTLDGHADIIRSVTFSFDGQTIASGSYDHTIKLWNATNGNLIRTLASHTDVVSSIAFSPDGQTIASGSWNGTILLWNTTNGNLIRTLAGHIGLVASIAFNPDGQTIASGSRDSTIKLWNATNGSLIRTLASHTSTVNSIAFSPDGQTIASGSLDNTIKLWGRTSLREALREPLAEFMTRIFLASKHFK